MKIYEHLPAICRHLPSGDAPWLREKSSGSASEKGKGAPNAGVIIHRSPIRFPSANGPQPECLHLFIRAKWANPKFEKLQKTTPRASILPTRRLPGLFMHPPRPAHPLTPLAPQLLPPFPSILRTASSSSAKVGSTSFPSPRTLRKRGSSLYTRPR